ncbi:MAG: ABC transporter permease [Treponema sp. GWB1_62_6]|nr:MAG: ABC transporter permease [Treponema sp. GWA1_62_8]OHE65820.1 MAG: ABC transporter permease [Treponema sp. GWC1_61_84]OHE71893.1 MAG: ABC transporter permease [Treponema sp. RIFOXYC1_FULL_61_9]OHE72209.1 MAG: ABC transporter permease [Treponema sp. GWB1_62_6]HCM28625.1 ABC transporter permease [Treponema sp.]
MSGILIIGIFVALMLCGIPIAASMAVPAGIYLVVMDIPVTTLIQRMVSSLNSFTLLAVPMFIFAANLMNNSGITNRLFDSTRLLVGKMRGGLAQVNVFASLVFAGISGAALADIGGIGNIELDAMKKQNYRMEDAAAITAASASIGPIFPPSIPLIIYAAAAETSSMRLLMAGVLPGILITGVLMLQVAFFARKYNWPRGIDGKWPKGEIIRIAKRGIPSMLMPMILMGGMLSGWFSPTEVAAVAITYAFILSFAYKSFAWADLVRIAKETLVSTASVLFIVAAAAIFAWTLTVEQLPQQASEALLSITRNPIVLLLMVNILLLIVGMFLETTAAIMIFTPILLPTLMEVGINPVHFGLVMVFNLMIGMLTPPVGMSIYMLSPMAGLPVNTLFKSVLPYLVPLFIALMILTFVPQISLWLPNLLYN